MVLIEKLIDLEVVQRAMMASRFGDGALDPVLLGSPYLARIHSAVVDDIVAFHGAHGQPEQVASWERWREMSVDRREWAVVRSRLSAPEMKWGNVPEHLKGDTLRTCFQPFRITDQLVDEMVRLLDGDTAASVE